MAMTAGLLDKGQKFKTSLDGCCLPQMWSKRAKTLEEYDTMMYWARSVYASIPTITRTLRTKQQALEFRVQTVDKQARMIEFIKFPLTGSDWFNAGLVVAYIFTGNFRESLR
jgi:hypothetical protein